MVETKNSRAFAVIANTKLFAAAAVAVPMRTVVIILLKTPVVSFGKKRKTGEFDP